MGFFTLYDILPEILTGERLLSQTRDAGPQSR